MKRFWAQEAEMSLTANGSLESARRKFILNSAYIMSRQLQSNVFGLKRPKWVEQLIAYTNREAEIFSSAPRTSCLESSSQTFLGQGDRNDSNTISSLESARRKFFMTRPTSCLESRNQRFLGSGGQNDSNSHQLVRIGEIKIFHELDGIHV